MDTDLFQILALILLLGLLLTLFGVLQSLGAIRKTLEGSGSSQPMAPPAAQPASAPATRESGSEPETWAHTSESESPAAATGEPASGGGARSGWPAPQEATETAAPAASTEPASTTGAGGRVLYGDEGLTTATPSETALRPAETTDAADTTAAASAGAAGSEIVGTMGAATGTTDLDTETPGGTTGTTGGGTSGSATVGQDFGDAAGAETAAGTAGAGTGTTGVSAGTTDTSAGTAGAGAVTERAASAAEDPQEQPFERDGRWWFRRGDELLVYEEQTGQWVAADEPSTSGSAAVTPGETAGDAPAEGQVTTQQEAVGSFWKCPSCGAVNGSTATSCRMCFTARP